MAFGMYASTSAKSLIIQLSWTLAVAIWRSISMTHGRYFLSLSASAIA